VADFFISHAAEDAELALQIAARLERDGLTAWIYERDARPGVPFDEQISEAIDGCAGLVVIISWDAVHRSHLVLKELRLATELGRQVLPILRGLNYDDLKDHGADDPKDFKDDEFKDLRRHGNWTFHIAGISAVTMERDDLDKVQTALTSFVRDCVGERPAPAPEPISVPGPAAAPTRVYKLFVHYVPPPHLKSLLKADPSGARTWDLIKDDMVRIFRQLDDLLAPAQGWRGRAFVFLDVGWTDVVYRRYPELTQEANLIGRLEGSLAAQGLIGRPGGNRLVTAMTLNDVLQVIRKGMPVDLQGLLDKFLVGGAQQLYYDAPKVAEAMVRIASIGRYEPVFRFDADVLLADGQPAPEETERVRTNILRLCAHFETLAAAPDVGYFVFSGGYIPRDEENRFRARTLPPKEYRRWAIDGFATRIVQLARYSPARDPALPVELSEEDVSSFLENLWRVGAHPYRQVVSGAGLCMSDGAILDLPPFSNMCQNVVWVDDHLKYALHHELRHFGHRHGTRQVARVRDAWFQQTRHRGAPTWQDLEWHLGSYLPRLLLGCLADAFLRENPRLKLSFATASEFDEVMTSSPGAYAHALIANAGRGLVEGARQELGAHLWKLARQRMKDVLDLFGRFPNTCLERFVVGVDERDPLLPDMAPRGLRRANRDIKWKTVPPFTSRDAAERAARRHASAAQTLELAVTSLIDDFLDYLDFTGLWSDLVFAVRHQLNQRNTANAEAVPIV